MSMQSLLELQVAAKAEIIRGDPNFGLAFQAFCTAVPDVFRAEPRLIRTLGDLGRFVVVATGFVRQHTAGITTLSEITKLALRGRFASARRVRAIVEEFIDIGVVRVIDGHYDKRKRPLFFNGWMNAALVHWAYAYIKPALPWIKLSMEEQQHERLLLPVTFMQHSVQAYLQHGFFLSKGYQDVQYFMEHHAGYLILLTMLKQAHRQPDGSASIVFSRKKTALDLRLSRAQIAIILAGAEKKGLLLRETQVGMGIHVPAVVYARWQGWIARELAWTAMAFGSD